MSQYLDYALDLDETRVVGLFAETLRDADGMRRALARAVERDIPVVALTVGGSPTGRSLVEAHSGAIAGDDAVWEALFSAYGVHRVTSLDELMDTLELFAIGRRVRPGTAREQLGVATVHDSGGERALVADRADALGIPFSVLADKTREVARRAARPRPRPGESAGRLGTRDEHGDVVRRVDVRAGRRSRRRRGGRRPRPRRGVRRRQVLSARHPDRRGAHGQAGGGAEQHRERCRPTAGRAAALGRYPCPGGHRLRA